MYVRTQMSKSVAADVQISPGQKAAGDYLEESPQESGHCDDNSNIQWKQIKNKQKEYKYLEDTN